MRNGILFTATLTTFSLANASCDIAWEDIPAQCRTFSKPANHAALRSSSASCPCLPYRHCRRRVAEPLTDLILAPADHIPEQVLYELYGEDDEPDQVEEMLDELPEEEEGSGEGSGDLDDLIYDLDGLVYDELEGLGALLGVDKDDLEALTRTAQEVIGDFLSGDLDGAKEAGQRLLQQMQQIFGNIWSRRRIAPEVEIQDVVDSWELTLSGLSAQQTDFMLALYNGVQSSAPTLFTDPEVSALFLELFQPLEAAGGAGSGEGSGQWFDEQVLYIGESVELLLGNGAALGVSTEDVLNLAESAQEVVAKFLEGDHDAANNAVTALRSNLQKLCNDADRRRADFSLDDLDKLQTQLNLSDDDLDTIVAALDSLNLSNDDLMVLVDALEKLSTVLSAQEIMELQHKLSSAFSATDVANLEKVFGKLVITVQPAATDGQSQDRRRAEKTEMRRRASCDNIPAQCRNPISTWNHAALRSSGAPCPCAQYRHCNRRLAVAEELAAPTRYN